MDMEYRFDFMAFDAFPAEEGGYNPTPDLSGSYIVPGGWDLSMSTVEAGGDLSGSYVVSGGYDLSNSTIMEL